MDNIKLDIIKVKTISPKAWQDIQLFYTDNFLDFHNKTGFELENLPFEMLIGVLLRYFIENGVEWDVVNTDYSLLPDTLYEVLETYEKVISHYS